MAHILVVDFTQVTNLLAPLPCRHITTSNLTYAVRSTRIAGTRSHAAAAAGARRCDAAGNADTVADIALRTRAAAADDTWTSCHRYITSPPLELRRIAMSVSVCLSVCMSVHSHISKTTCPNFTKFCVHVTTGNNAIRYALPVLWMTSCSTVIGKAKATPIGCIHKVPHQSAAPGGKSDTYVFFHVYISICSTLQMHLFAFIGSVPFVP